MGMGRLPLKIGLRVTHHCVETEIRRQYNRCLSQFFRSGERSAEFESSLTLLQHALENFDFQAIRSRYPELSGHSDADAVLTIDKNGDPVLTLDKKVIYP